MEIHARKYHIVLANLNAETLEVGEDICEIISFNSTFTLNQIPVATVGLAPGINMLTGEEAIVLDKVNSFVANMSPICVVVKPVNTDFDGIGYYEKLGSTNDDDPDGEFDSKNSYCIFKGYAVGLGFSKAGDNVQLDLYIQHWLADLSAISVYSPRIHMSSAEAYGTYLTAVGHNVTKRTWDTTDKDTLDAIFGGKDIGTILITVLKDVLNISTESNESAIGATSPELIKKVNTILDERMDTSGVQWSGDVKELIPILADEMKAAIGVKTASSWGSMSAWDKLVSDWASDFMYALLPTVDKCYMIPVPGPVADSCFALQENKLFTIDNSMPTKPILGGVVLIKTPSTIATAEQDLAFVYANMISHVYPPLDAQEQAAKADSTLDIAKSVGGPIMTCNLPGWLQKPAVSDVTCQSDIGSSYSDFELLKNTTLPAAELAQSKLKRMDAIALLYTSYVYCANVFSNRQLTISTPFTAKVVPGMSIAVRVKPNIVNEKGASSEEQTIELYGTVASVTTSLRPQDYITTITITNVRNKEEYQNIIYNPPTHPLFESTWSGTDIDFRSKV